MLPERQVNQLLKGRIKNVIDLNFLDKLDDFQNMFIEEDELVGLLRDEGLNQSTSYGEQFSKTGVLWK